MNPDVDQATLVAGSVAGSGAGPQIYAEKTGRGSARSPREMMIPIASSVSMMSLTFFFIGRLVLGFSRP